MIYHVSVNATNWVDFAFSAITIPTLTPRRSFNELERLKPGSKCFFPLHPIHFNVCKLYVDACTVKSVLQRNMRGSRSKRRGQSVRARRAPKTRVTPSQNSQREPETETESETESDSDQTVSADSSEETEEVEASPLPASRPMDPVKAIEYDTTKALWRPSSRAVSSADMEATLKTFWEVVRPIREQWMVLEKEDAGKKGSDESLKVKFASELQKLKSALETAVRVSHRMILERYVLLLAPDGRLLRQCHLWMEKANLWGEVLVCMPCSLGSCAEFSDIMPREMNTPESQLLPSSV